MRNYDAEIARHVLAAQLCSDRAKSVDDYIDSQLCYGQKDINILSAIQKIAKCHSKKWRFAVQDGKIGSRSNLVYFTYSEGGERFQVSFHNFSEEVRKFARGSSHTHWDENSSREAAYEIARRYGVVREARRQAPL